MSDKDDQQQLEAMGRDLGEAIATSFGSQFQKIVCFILDEKTDAIRGIFQGKNSFYQFSLPPRNILTYSELALKVRSDSLADPYWQGRAEVQKRYRHDGRQIKKNCNPAVSVPCGEACIPRGAICHQGLPTAQQARVVAVRTILKASRAVARAAAVVALGVGTAALAAYAVKKAGDANLGDKVRRAAESFGMTPDAIQGVQDFTAQVADAALPKRVSEAIANGRNVAVARVQAKSMNFLDRTKMKATIAAREYVNNWRAAPVETAMAHASVGLLLYGAEQAGEHLGYIPRGSLERSVGSEAMKERMSKIKMPSRSTPKVNNRNPEWGA